jgi:hypothetical protein
MIKKIQKYYSKKARLKRGRIFNEVLSPYEGKNILDLGGWNGAHINSVIKGKCNITIADISEVALSQAKQKYNYGTVLINENEKLDFHDSEFDIVFCNSVIEHVTLPKSQVWNFTSTKDFKNLAFKRQKDFADEIRRISKSYFVQTPNKYFLIESHTWLPAIIVFLPRYLLIKILGLFNKFWVKKTSPDWNLLTINQMKLLFPDAKIYTEKSLGMIKSIIAIRNLSN